MKYLKIYSDYISCTFFRYIDLPVRFSENGQEDFIHRWDSIAEVFGMEKS